MTLTVRVYVVAATPTLIPPTPNQDEHMSRYAPGDPVEISPTDEGYVGSWYEGTVIATSGGKPGELHLEYTTLEESEA